MEHRIMENIRHDVRQHILTGRPMPTGRGPKFDSFTAQALIEEKNKIDDTFFRTQHQNLKVTIEFEDWYQIARALYRIEGYTVTSIAKGPNFEKSWSFKSHGDCLNKIAQLIRIKKYDHDVKGYDFAYVPEMLKVG